MQFILRTLP